MSQRSAMTPRRAEALLWLALLAAGAVSVGLATDWGDALRPRSEAPAPSLARVDAPTLAGMPALPAIDALPETLARPMFVVTRRPSPPPPPPPPTEAPRPQMQRGQFALAGTSLVDGRSLAFLTEIKGGKYRVVAEGDTVNGIRVSQVRPDRVVLAQYDETETLQLPVRTVKGAPPPAQPAPGAAPSATPAPPAPGPAMPVAGSATPAEPQPQPKAQPGPQPQAVDASRYLGNRPPAAVTPPMPAAAGDGTAPVSPLPGWDWRQRTPGKLPSAPGRP